MSEPKLAERVMWAMAAIDRMGVDVGEEHSQRYVILKLSHTAEQIMERATYAVANIEDAVREIKRAAEVTK